jgi:uncharacterized protein
MTQEQCDGCGASAVRRAPQLTAETFVIPLLPQRFIVYAPLRRAAFIANTRLINLLSDIKDGCAAPTDIDDETLDLLRELQIIDAEPEQRPITTFAGPPKPTNLTLFMTTGCNLRCTYCYASAGEKPLKSMSLETAQRGVDFVAGNAAETESRRFTMVYHGGGEPTVNWSVLTQSFDYAQAKAHELGLNFTAASATNGVLRDEQIDWIIENLEGGASLSFDGLPELHDKHRLTVSGQGSSERVLHTMERFEAAGFPMACALPSPTTASRGWPKRSSSLARAFARRGFRLNPRTSWAAGKTRPRPKRKPSLPRFAKPARSHKVMARI